jgi:mannose-6-phosphate isomerase-like protein (cupin superfamily)
MITGDLKEKSFLYTGSNLASLKISEKQSGDNIEPVSKYLRYFFSTSYWNLTSQDKTQFVTNRSAVKVHPGKELRVDIDKTEKIYEIVLEKDENTIMRKLKNNYQWFFDGLTGEDRKEWDLVKDAGIDYIIDGEPNSDRMQKLDGILIAPPYARFKDNIGNGWHFMYSRASPALGVGSDANFKMRQQEAIHIHKVTTETYVCIGGELELMINGDKKILRPGEFLLAEPGDTHAMISFPKAPYEGITLQLPSLPGDKYTPSGERIERFWKK